jgi:3-phosphoshikimate 1-carboxyvinyltransferase
VQPGEQWGHLPVTIQGLRTGSVPAVNSVAMPGDISSQYITALMLIAPYLANGLQIHLTTPLVSRPYVAITAAVMRSFGVSGVTVGEHSVSVAPGRYTACDYSIEPDASSASYAFAAAAICGGHVSVPHLGPDALQGDATFAGVLASMGCTVTRTAEGTSVQRDAELRGISINMADLSDLVPTLAVIAPFASSPTEITGVGFIRAKESDRLGDLAGELRKCGIDATEQPDGIVVRPGYSGGAALDTHHDHRLAMAFGVLGMRIAGVRVHDPDVVSKSWPDFWMALEAMRGAA